MNIKIHPVYKDNKQTRILGRWVFYPCYCLHCQNMWFVTKPTYENLKTFSNRHEICPRCQSSKTKKGTKHTNIY